MHLIHQNVWWHCHSQQFKVLYRTLWENLPCFPLQLPHWYVFLCVEPQHCMAKSNGLIIDVPHYQSPSPGTVGFHLCHSYHMGLLGGLKPMWVPVCLLDLRTGLFGSSCSCLPRCKNMPWPNRWINPPRKITQCFYPSLIKQRIHLPGSICKGHKY